MAERDAVADELDERLNGDQTHTPDDEAPEPDLEDDAEGDPDQPDPEPDGPDEVPEQDVAPERPRARDRIQSLQRERDAERDRASRAEAERDRARDEALAARQRDTAAAEQAREAALLETMDEGQRVQYLLAREVKKTQEGQQTILRRLDDSSDRAEFATKAARDPRRQKLMDEVEREYQKLAPTVPGLKRDGVFLFLLGKRIDDGTFDVQAGKQRRAAGDRLAAQRSAPRGARSNTTARGARGGSLSDRMERDDPAI